MTTMATSKKTQKRAMKGLVGGGKFRKADPDAPYCILCHASLNGRRWPVLMPPISGAVLIACDQACELKHQGRIAELTSLG